MNACITFFNIYYILYFIARQGRQFDLNGNLVDWWKSETKSHYLEKAKCIIEQYGNYTEPTTGIKVRIILVTALDKFYFFTAMLIILFFFL